MPYTARRTLKKQRLARAGQRERGGHVRRSVAGDARSGGGHAAVAHADDESAAGDESAGDAGSAEESAAGGESAGDAGSGEESAAGGDALSADDAAGAADADVGTDVPAGAEDDAAVAASTSSRAGKGLRGASKRATRAAVAVSSRAASAVSTRASGAADGAAATGGDTGGDSASSSRRGTKRATRAESATGGDTGGDGSSSRAPKKRRADLASRGRTGLRSADVTADDVTDDEDAAADVVVVTAATKGAAKRAAKGASARVSKGAAAGASSSADDDDAAAEVAVVTAATKGATKGAAKGASARVSKGAAAGASSSGEKAAAKGAAARLERRNQNVGLHADLAAVAAAEAAAAVLAAQQAAAASIAAGNELGAVKVLAHVGDDGDIKASDLGGIASRELQGARRASFSLHNQTGSLDASSSGSAGGVYIHTVSRELEVGHEWGPVFLTDVISLVARVGGARRGLPLASREPYIASHIEYAAGVSIASDVDYLEWCEVEALRVANTASEPYVPRWQSCPHLCCGFRALSVEVMTYHLSYDGASHVCGENAADCRDSVAAYRPSLQLGAVWDGPAVSAHPNPHDVYNAARTLVAGIALETTIIRHLRSRVGLSAPYCPHSCCSHSQLALGAEQHLHGGCSAACTAMVRSTCLDPVTSPPLSESEAALAAAAWELRQRELLRRAAYEHPSIATGLSYDDATFRSIPIFAAGVGANMPQWRALQLCSPYVQRPFRGGCILWCAHSCCGYEGFTSYEALDAHFEPEKDYSTGQKPFSTHKCELPHQAVTGFPCSKHLREEEPLTADPFSYPTVSQLVTIHATYSSLAAELVAKGAPVAAASRGASQAASQASAVLAASSAARTVRQQQRGVPTPALREFDYSGVLTLTKSPILTPSAFAALTTPRRKDFIRPRLISYRPYLTLRGAMVTSANMLNVPPLLDPVLGAPAVFDLRRALTQPRAAMELHCDHVTKHLPAQVAGDVAPAAALVNPSLDAMELFERFGHNPGGPPSARSYVAVPGLWNADAPGPQDFNIEQRVLAASCVAFVPPESRGALAALVRTVVMHGHDFDSHVFQPLFGSHLLYVITGGVHLQRVPEQLLPQYLASAATLLHSLPMPGKQGKVARGVQPVLRVVMAYAGLLLPPPVYLQQCGIVYYTAQLQARDLVVGETGPRYFLNARAETVVATAPLFDESWIVTGLPMLEKLLRFMTFLETERAAADPEDQASEDGCEVLAYATSRLCHLVPDVSCAVLLSTAVEAYRLAATPLAADATAFVATHANDVVHLQPEATTEVHLATLRARVLAYLAPRWPSSAPRNPPRQRVVELYSDVIRHVFDLLHSAPVRQFLLRARPTAVLCGGGHTVESHLASVLRPFSGVSVTPLATRVVVSGIDRGAVLCAAYLAAYPLRAAGVA